MNAEEFREAQETLGLNRADMATAIGMSPRSVDEMRGGRRPVTTRTQMIVEMLLSSHETAGSTAPVADCVGE